LLLQTQAINFSKQKMLHHTVQCTGSDWRLSFSSRE